MYFRTRATGWGSSCANVKTVRDVLIQLDARNPCSICTSQSSAAVHVMARSRCRRNQVMCSSVPSEATPGSLRPGCTCGAAHDSSVTRYTQHVPITLQAPRVTCHTMLVSSIRRRHTIAPWYPHARCQHTVLACRQQRQRSSALVVPPHTRGGWPYCVTNTAAG